MLAQKPKGTLRASISDSLIIGPVAQPDGSSVFEFKFSANDPVFAGHFPGRPLLPGIFQIELGRMAAQKVLGRDLVIREISKAKFLRPILPEEIIRLSLKLVEEPSIIQARAGLLVGGQPAGEIALRLWRKE